MKKLFKNGSFILCALALTVVGTFASSGIAKAATKAETPKIVNVQQNMNNITIKWKKIKGISTYKIYRIDLDKYFNGDFEKDFPKVKDYVMVKKVNGKTNKYVDKKVKKSTEYTYFIEGIGKSKKVTSYKSGSYPGSFCAGLAVPSLHDYYEKQTVTKIYLGAFTNGKGVEPTGFQVYKKASFKKDFRLLKPEKLDKNTFCDKLVTPGRSYIYKIRSYKKVGKKTVYSPFSKELTFTTVNQNCKLSAITFTEEGKDVDTFTMKLSSYDGYNGVAKINKTCEYFYTNNKENSFCSGEVISYSLDNKTWLDMPAEGVDLDCNKAIYLKIKLTPKEGELLYFGGVTSETSLLTRLVTYTGTSGHTGDDGDINLTTGIGYAGYVPDF